ncbi:hypothetical protein LCGC14_2745460 [marine sediment metagenome]|uniref:Acb2/Tad1 hairpin domain-containing protein n=1 Tax=marine sediment metagenome TaxID=412755 RepID=A0A0F8Z3C6_9ZZZZ
MITKDRINHDFSYHPATPKTGPKHDRVRELLLETAAQLVDIVPDGREQSVAVTKLEEAMFWANAGIARGG